jgi:DNA topoisomerase VI subunit A
LKSVDLEEYEIPNECFQSLTNVDLKKIEELKSRVQEEEEILKELNEMKKKEKKAEIECLSFKSIEFLSERLKLF